MNFEDKKEILEEKIELLVHIFEQETGCLVNNIDVVRSSVKNEKGQTIISKIEVVTNKKEDVQ